jgi:hypothetical protein
MLRAATALAHIAATQQESFPYLLSGKLRVSAPNSPRLPHPSLLSVLFLIRCNIILSHRLILIFLDAFLRR